MPRPKGNIERVKISITTSRRIADLIDSLIDTELYGSSRADIAGELLRETIKRYLDENKFEKYKKK